MTDLSQLPVEDFEAITGHDVAVRGPDGDQTCRVEEVVRSKHPTGRAHEPGFSVYLRGPAQPALAQGIHAVEHPRHGTLELFLTPVARDVQGMRYEIVFN